MPEMQFRVRWPDGRTSAHYSPSLVMHDHLAVGVSYPVQDFLSRVRTGLTEASDRVRARYGMPCSAALASLAEIESVGAEHTAAAAVTVLQMHPPLPASGPAPQQISPTSKDGTP